MMRKTTLKDTTAVPQRIRIGEVENIRKEYVYKTIFLYINNHILKQSGQYFLY